MYLWLTGMAFYTYILTKNLKTASTCTYDKADMCSDLLGADEKSTYN